MQVALPAAIWKTIVLRFARVMGKSSKPPLTSIGDESTRAGIADCTPGHWLSITQGAGHACRSLVGRVMTSVRDQ